MKNKVTSIASLLPSKSLRSHRCVQLLWLPLHLCIQYASENRTTELNKTSNDIASCSSSSTNNNNNNNNTTNNIIIDGSMQIYNQTSGFEQRVLSTLLNEPFMSMSSLRGVFPAATEYYSESAILELSINIANDASSIVTSPWANIEAHKSVTAVVVIVNCHDYDPCIALHAVKVIFQTYFKESICRCIVLDPTKEAESLMSQHVFLPTYVNTPAEDVAKYLFKEVALSIVQQLNSRIVALKSSPDSAIIAEKLISDDISGNNGGINSISGNNNNNNNNNNSENLKKNVIDSRISKRKGDLLMMLGALDAALLAYHESLVSPTTLWTSSTLESLAALRYLQRFSLISISKEVEIIFTSLESDDEAVWNDEMNNILNKLEKVITKMRTDQRRASSLLKQNLAASPLNKKLLREIEDPLSLQCENLKKQITIIRKYFTTEPKESSLSSSGIVEASINALSIFRNIIHISFLELHLYLNEALQNIRTISGSQKLLREHEVEILLKRTELFAEEKDKKNFLESLTILKTNLKNVPESMQRQIREFIPSLNSLCGCGRKAIFFIVEAAASERKAKDFDTAMRLLVRACTMAGIQIPNTEFQFSEEGELADVVNMININSHQRVFSDSCVGVVGSNSSQNEIACIGRPSRRAQDVPLLLELLHTAVESGVYDNMQSVIASLLLFEYYSFLHRDVQQSLMDIIERRSVELDPILSISPPLLYNMEIIPLPSHLAPKTIPLSGAQFTFIDTGRLKMTLLTLNGKILSRGQVVWSVGTVGEVEIVLTNPFRRDLQITSIALSCRSIETLDDVNILDKNNLGYIVGPLAPSSYVVTGVILPSLSKRQIRLQVQPNIKGYLIIDGVEIRLGQLPLCSTFIMPSPKLTTIPVLEQLPLISCILGLNEVQIFGGQTIRFPIHLINSGSIKIEKLFLSVHDESCQLDVCNGCKERVNNTSLYVILENNSLESENLTCLNPGESILTNITMVSPVVNDDIIFQHIVFRVTVELPYDTPIAPKNIPSAVPVFAVIPRRVQETYLRVFHVPSVSVTSLALSHDRRFVEITVKNKSQVHTIELFCSKMIFASIPDALVVAGAEYLIPPIEITKFPPGIQNFSLPWMVRELPECRGVLTLDFSIIANEVVCTEPLEDALISILISNTDDIQYNNINNNEINTQYSSLQWLHGAVNEFPFTVPVMKPLILHICVSAPWGRGVPVRVRLAMENHLDADILSGPIDTRSIIGGGEGNSEVDKEIIQQQQQQEQGQEQEQEQGKNKKHYSGKRYEEDVEFFAFKTGEHVLVITLSDLDGREMTYTVRLHAVHL